MAVDEAPVPAILDVPIDPGAYIRACPARSTTLGTFFHHVVEAVAGPSLDAPPGLLDGLTRDRWVAFRKYELREFMRLIVNAAALLHGDVPLAEGLRRLGRLAYPSFASTMAGRVVLFAFGENVHHLAAALPKAYAVGVPDANVEVRRLGETHYVIDYSNVHCFVDTYHLGVLEGGLFATGVHPEITVRRGRRICDARFEGRW